MDLKIRQDCSTEVDYSSVVVEERIAPFIIELDGSSVLNPGPGENQKFCYSITGVGEDTSEFVDLSHWVLVLCPNITEEQITNVQVFIDGVEQDVEFGSGGNVELFVPPQTDPPTGCPGLKFDFGLSKVAGSEDSVGLFCFELTTPYPVCSEGVDTCLSAGGITFSGLSICGPCCTAPERGIRFDF